MANNLEKLLEAGMVKYFYHSPSSDLPVRDVLGEYNDKNTNKTEPHIEIGVENFLKKCYQNNICKAFKKKGGKALWPSGK